MHLIKYRDNDDDDDDGSMETEETRMGFSLQLLATVKRKGIDHRPKPLITVNIPRLFDTDITTTQLASVLRSRATT